MLILWWFYIAENPETTETEPVPVERFEGFIICKSLGYQDEVIKKAYLANDSKVLLFFLFIFDFYFVQCQGATVTAWVYFTLVIVNADFLLGDSKHKHCITQLIC